MLSEQEGYPVAVVCQVLGLARSSYYYRAVEKDEDEVEALVRGRTSGFIRQPAQ
jgi:hypothetical protein